jgi:nitrate/nitrite transporter NarK
VLFAAFFAGTGCLDVSTAGAEGPAGMVFSGALVAGDFFVAGLAAARVRDLVRFATWRLPAGGVAGFVAPAAGAGCVVLDPNAAWTVAKASSSESWRVSTVTFIRCSWAGEVAMSDRNVRPEVDVAASTLALLDGLNRDLAPAT